MLALFYLHVSYRIVLRIADCLCIVVFMGSARGDAKMGRAKMDQDLQKALTSILNKSMDAVETGVLFLQKELPDVIQQLLVWHAVKSAIWFVIYLILTFVLYRLSKKFWAWATEEDYGYEPVVIFPVFACILTGVLALHSTDWLQILIAPKLYLIEYAASLAK